MRDFCQPVISSFMQIAHFYSEQNGKISFTRQQASDFAKQVANDFNPIHDTDAKRFCVPGDLLFSVALSKIGLSQRMQVTFADMVTDGIDLTFPQAAEAVDGDKAFSIDDDNGKTYLKIERSGETTQDTRLIQDLTQRYVEFSGQTFPHILVPLWQQHNVMINPARPLVIYESMSIDLDNLDFTAPQLEVTESSLDVQGKRGNVTLAFCLRANGQVVGRGEKKMVLSGLREFDQAAVDGVVEYYNDRKQQFV